MSLYRIVIWRILIEMYSGTRLFSAVAGEEVRRDGIFMEDCRHFLLLRFEMKAPVQKRFTRML